MAPESKDSSDGKEKFAQWTNSSSAPYFLYSNKSNNFVFPNKKLSTRVENDEKNFSYLVKKIEKSENKILELSSMRDSIEKLLTDYTEKYSQIEKSIVDIKGGMENFRKEKVNLVEILGIFVSIFTFISVEIKILADVDHKILPIAGLTLVMMGALIFFVLLIDVISSRWISSKYSKLPLGLTTIAVTAIVIGVIITGYEDIIKESPKPVIVNENDFSFVPIFELNHLTSIKK